MHLYHVFTHSSVRFVFAAIWLVNGFFCKVLGLVPRHERIVAVILGETHAHLLTMLIGVAEIAMAAWIISGWRYRFCASVQIAVILMMNLIEFFAVPHLLLWGRLNLVFALVLFGFIDFNAFGRPKEP